jgi:hypothetical protein
MKVCLADTSLLGLRHLLYKFGHDCVDMSKLPELVIRNDEVLPEIIRLSLFGELETDRSARPHYGITRFAFEGKVSEQVACVLPVWGTCNENLGAEQIGAVGIRFLPAGSLSEMFHNGLHMVLEESKYTGFVTLSFAEGADTPLAIHLGVPWHGIYALVECMRGSLVDFWLSPWRLFEQWSVCLPILSQLYPEYLVKQFVVGGVDPQIADSVHVFSKNIQLSSQFVGVVTGGHGNLNSACYKVLEIARRLVIPEKQFRTDFEFELGHTWKQLRPKLVSSQSIA